jgi:DNA repair protein RadC
MSHLVQEEFRVLTLTTKHDVISSPTIYVGNVGSAVLRPAEVFRPAVVDFAPAIVVAHNHPSGDPTPSPDDIQVTRKLIEAGRLLDIHVLDHVVIGDGRFVSITERGHAI